MKATWDRIVILAAAAGALVGAHFLPDMAAEFLGIAGLLTGLQIPYGNTGPSPKPPTG